MLFYDLQVVTSTMVAVAAFNLTTEGQNPMCLQRSLDGRGTG